MLNWVQGSVGVSVNAGYNTTQHRQYRGRPPLTDDGGVAGAKYACTLSSGRRVCSTQHTVRAVTLHAQKGIQSHIGSGAKPTSFPGRVS